MVFINKKYKSVTYFLMLEDKINIDLLLDILSHPDSFGQNDPSLVLGLITKQIQDTFLEVEDKLVKRFRDFEIKHHFEIPDKYERTTKPIGLDDDLPNPEVFFQYDLKSALENLSKPYSIKNLVQYQSKKRFDFYQQTNIDVDFLLIEADELIKSENPQDLFDVLLFGIFTGFPFYSILASCKLYFMEGTIQTYNPSYTLSHFPELLAPSFRIKIENKVRDPIFVCNQSNLFIQVSDMVLKCIFPQNVKLEIVSQQDLSDLFIFGHRDLLIFVSADTFLFLNPYTKLFVSRTVSHSSRIMGACSDGKYIYVLYEDNMLVSYDDQMRYRSRRTLAISKVKFAKIRTMVKRKASLILATLNGTYKYDFKSKIIEHEVVNVLITHDAYSNRTWSLDKNGIVTFVQDRPTIKYDYSSGKQVSCRDIADNTVLSLLDIVKDDNFRHSFASERAYQSFLEQILLFGNNKKYLDLICSFIIISFRVFPQSYLGVDISSIANAYSEFHQSNLLLSVVYGKILNCGKFSANGDVMKIIYFCKDNVLLIELIHSSLIDSCYYSNKVEIIAKIFSLSLKEEDKSDFFTTLADYVIFLMFDALRIYRDEDVIPDERAKKAEKYVTVMLDVIYKEISEGRSISTQIWNMYLSILLGLLTCKAGTACFMSSMLFVSKILDKPDSIPQAYIRDFYTLAMNMVKVNCQLAHVKELTNVIMQTECEFANNSSPPDIVSEICARNNVQISKIISVVNDIIDLKEELFIDYSFIVIARFFGKEKYLKHPECEELKFSIETFKEVKSFVLEDMVNNGTSNYKQEFYKKVKMLFSKHPMPENEGSRTFVIELLNAKKSIVNLEEYKNNMKLCSGDLMKLFGCCKTSEDYLDLLMFTKHINFLDALGILSFYDDYFREVGSMFIQNFVKKLIKDNEDIVLSIPFTMMNFSPYRFFRTIFTEISMHVSDKKYKFYISYSLLYLHTHNSNLSAIFDNKFDLREEYNEDIQVQTVLAKVGVNKDMTIKRALEFFYKISSRQIHQQINLLREVANSANDLKVISMLLGAIGTAFLGGITPLVTMVLDRTKKLEECELTTQSLILNYAYEIILYIRERILCSDNSDKIRKLIYDSLSSDDLTIKLSSFAILSEVILGNYTNLPIKTRDGKNYYLHDIDVLEEKMLVTRLPIVYSVETDIIDLDIHFESNTIIPFSSNLIGLNESLKVIFENALKMPTKPEQCYSNIFVLNAFLSYLQENSFDSNFLSSLLYKGMVNINFFDDGYTKDMIQIMMEKRRSYNVVNSDLAEFTHISSLGASEPNYVITKTEIEVKSSAHTFVTTILNPKLIHTLEIDLKYWRRFPSIGIARLDSNHNYLDAYLVSSRLYNSYDESNVIKLVYNGPCNSLRVETPRGESNHTFKSLGHFVFYVVLVEKSIVGYSITNNLVKKNYKPKIFTPIIINSKTNDGIEPIPSLSHEIDMIQPISLYQVTSASTKLTETYLLDPVQGKLKYKQIYNRITTPGVPPPHFEFYPILSDHLINLYMTGESELFRISVCEKIFNTALIRSQEPGEVLKYLYKNQKFKYFLYNLLSVEKFDFTSLNNGELPIKFDKNYMLVDDPRAKTAYLIYEHMTTKELTSFADDWFSHLKFWLTSKSYVLKNNRYSLVNIKPLKYKCYGYVIMHCKVGEKYVLKYSDSFEDDHDPNGCVYIPIKSNYMLIDTVIECLVSLKYFLIFLRKFDALLHSKFKQDVYELFKFEFITFCLNDAPLFSRYFDIINKNIDDVANFGRIDVAKDFAIKISSHIIDRLSNENCERLLPIISYAKIIYGDIINYEIQQRKYGEEEKNQKQKKI